MSFVELLRNRMSFAIFGSILILVTLLITIPIAWSIHGSGDSAVKITHRAETSAAAKPSPGGVHVSVAIAGNTTHESDTFQLPNGDFRIPLGIILGLAGLIAIIYATVICTSLNKENCNGGFAFTKPISRERLALTYFAVDGVAILAAFALQVLVGLVVLACLGLAGKVYVDDSVGWIVLITLGVALMWYGLIQALTSSLRIGGGMFIGIAWGTFSVLATLQTVPHLGTIHDVVTVLNFLNPLAYFSSFTTSDDARVTSSNLLGLDGSTRIILPWTIGIAGCALAILGWKRVEV
jgi:hypothetical protein